MPILRIILAFTLSFQLIGCATIISGSTEKVDIFASVAETRIYVNDVYVGQAGPDISMEITIPKKGRIELVGKKQNCDEAAAVVRRTIDPLTFLGLLIDGGLVSILFVDILGTNAFVHADQKSYVLELDCHK